ncbi:MAG: CatB-related O-acetyltransferase [Verrucomicrobia bacterium]|nr:CatB-related O-acetyltransferase [Verrucomicrobiota bacterium]
MLLGPNPNTSYPIEGYDKLVFLKKFIKANNISIGDYTYYDDRKEGPENFEENNVLYNYHPDKVKLVIGKFCAIAAETKFIMTGDHKLDAISTYPFPIFKNGWEKAYDILKLPVKGDIIVGHDVWFGFGCLIKNGVTIGSGSIIAAGAVVVKDVPPYSVVAGNPAKVVKMRFDDQTIKRLLQIAWWEWDIKDITEHLSLLSHLNIDQLEAVKGKISDSK